MPAFSQLSLFAGKGKSKVTPLAPPTEFEIHCMVADVLRRWGTIGWEWTHFPAGEKRLLPTGKRLKRMGLKRGWPDFILCSPYPPKVYFLELKRPGETLTDEQTEMKLFFDGNDYPYAVAFGFQEAVNVLKDWGVVRARVSV